MNMNDDDVVSTRTILRNAEQKRTVDSWITASLGPVNPIESNLQDDDDAGEYANLFEEESTFTGLGFVPPTTQDGQQDRYSLNANDKLRQQLLGNKAKSSGRGSHNARGGAPALAASKPRPVSAFQKKSGDSEDEAEGRSRLGSRKSQNKVRDESAKEVEVSTVEMGSSVPPSVNPNSKKRPMSYLDQVLTEREAKKKRKQQKKAAQ